MSNLLSPPATPPPPPCPPSPVSPTSKDATALLVATPEDDTIPDTRRPLPKEVWMLIAQYVRKALPERGEIKERSQIRQVDLTRMMSVSKLVNNATAPILYRFVIADDLYGLLCGYTSGLPAASGICSKAELLLLTRTLYLEYPIRPMTDTHDYHLMTEDFHRPGLRERPSGGFFPGKPDHRPNASLASLVEAEWLFVRYPQTQFHISMPNLENMSCGGLFGTDEHGWSVCKGYIADFENRLKSIQRIFAQMYLGGKVINYCQSGIYSAYCIDRAEVQSFQPTPPTETRARESQSKLEVRRTLTLHVTLTDYRSRYYDDLFGNMVSYPGVLIRWYFDSDLFSRSATFLGVSRFPPFLEAIEWSMLDGFGGRHQRLLNDEGQRAWVTKFDVEAYIPITDEVVDKMFCHLADCGLLASISAVGPENQEARSRERTMVMEGMTRKVMQTLMDGGKGRSGYRVLSPRDRVKIFHIEDDCPPCLACEWEPGMRGGIHGQTPKQNLV